MSTIARHQLIRLNAAGWARAAGQAGSAEASLCLRHWADQGLPVVVTRQACQAVPGDGSMSVGIAAPLQWGRVRVPLLVRQSDIAYFDGFPEAKLACRLMPREGRAAWQALFQALSSAGLRCRVYGSFGWQLLTDLAYLHPGSDVDLLVFVGGPEEADVAAGLLGQHGRLGLAPRVDGELVFGNGSAVSWREWLSWRSGTTASILVKSAHGVALADSLGFTQRRWVESPELSVA